MALIRSGLATSEWQNYQLGDYEVQKKAFLQGIADEAEQMLQVARQKAGGILKDAHAKGLEQANSELARKKEEGFKKGYEEGLAKGKSESMALEKQRIDAEILPLLETLLGMMGDFGAKAELLYDAAEKTLVKASLDLARQVIEVESTLNPEVLNVRLTKALQFLRPGVDLRLRLPLGGRAILEPLLLRMLETEGIQSKVEWTEDEQLSAGSLVVSTGDSVIQFESQLQWASLLEKLKLKESV
jgi:flagellar biosynthesis/type III secretory pathway protein FliH